MLWSEVMLCVDTYSLTDGRRLKEGEGYDYKPCVVIFPCPSALKLRRPKASLSGVGDYKIARHQLHLFVLYTFLCCFRGTSDAQMPSRSKQIVDRLFLT